MDTLGAAVTSVSLEIKIKSSIAYQGGNGAIKTKTPFKKKPVSLLFKKMVKKNYMTLLLWGMI